MKDDLAISGVESSQYCPTRRRLARAALSHEPQRLALENMQADAIHSFHCPSAAAQETLLERKIFFEIFHLEQHTAFFRHFISPVHITDSALNVVRPLG